jgi:hypothetical protein
MSKYSEHDFAGSDTVWARICWAATVAITLGGFVAAPLVLR